MANRGRLEQILGGVPYGPIGSLIGYFLPKRRARGVSMTKGATTGALIGSYIAPGIGTAIGALAGGALGGLFGGESPQEKQERLRRQRILEMLQAQASGRLTPQQRSALDIIRRQYAQAGAQAGRQLGASLARRGLTRSPMAAGMQTALARSYTQRALDTIAGQRAAWQQSALGRLAGLYAGQPAQQPDTFWSDLLTTLAMMRTYGYDLGDLFGFGGWGRPAQATTPEPSYGLHGTYGPMPFNPGIEHGFIG